MEFSLSLCYTAAGALHLRNAKRIFRTVHRFSCSILKGSHNDRWGSRDVLWLSFNSTCVLALPSFPLFRFKAVLVWPLAGVVGAMGAVRAGREKSGDA